MGVKECRRRKKGKAERPESSIVINGDNCKERGKRGRQTVRTDR